ncbi:MAG TPA: SDR family NAD(P)-dependent oxidoreductase, partial [Myxococcota bacterium]|nr:SDR family NAD(P)-dependent oxidoreductase [Myxococcota bacterium]
MPTYLVTGATQGLGRAIAAALAATPDARVVRGVRAVARGEEVARALGPRAEVRRLDLASLADVRRFAAEWQGPLAGLVNNAGVQITGGTRRTADGFEETIAVNHLAALLLTVGLWPHLAGGRVLFIGSGTHHPHNRNATVFGFRGARLTTVERIARGEVDTSSARQAGLDRYATSKFLNMLTAAELARRVRPERTLVFALDPGLMPGTGLARTAPAPVRALWSTLLKWVAPLLPETSTPERSGAAAAWLLTAGGLDRHHGETFSFDRAPSRRVWEPVRDPALGRAALDES